MTVLVATGAVLVTWLVVAIVLLAVGLITRHGLLSLAGLASEPAPCVADLWTGLAAITCYLLFWSLIAGIGLLTWALPLAVAAAGLWLMIRNGLPRPTLGRATVPFAALVVWLANMSIGRPTSYDSGLYHFAIVTYARHSAAIPGLGNLYDKLAAGDAHLLFVSFLEIGPWAGAGEHLANGLILALLVVQLWTILARAGRPDWDLMSVRVAALMCPALVIFLANAGSEAVSSPGLDVPIAALAIAAGLSLARARERPPGQPYVIGGVGALASGLATRPLVLPALAASAAVLIVIALHRSQPRLFAIVAATAVLPLATVAGLAARQIVLSGYPFFPIGALGVPVRWRLPEEALSSYRAWAAAWARLPGHSPDQVQAWGDWIGSWTRSTLTDRSLTVVFALVLIGSVLPLVYRGAADRAARDRRAPAAAVILVPSVAVLLVWFFSAPAIRFAVGWLWLVAAGLVAWLLPTFVGHNRRLLPIAVAAAVVTVGVAHAVATNTGALVVHESGGGPFGSAEPPIAPATKPYTTRSGLRLRVPSSGDRCWRVLWCTPYPNPRLSERGDHVESGLILQRR